MLRICVAGATGWVGRALCPAIEAAPDLRLVGTATRARPVAAVLAAAPADVLVDYTTPDAVKGNVLAAIAAGVHAVIGTSGLDDADFAELDAAARAAGVGVLAAGNFAISAVLLQHFALVAARFLPAWEIIDYAAADKPDAPSGTARQLASRLAAVRPPTLAVPVAATQGSPAARGLTLAGTQVHSVRLPGHVIGAEVLFGQPSERLSLRYDGGAGAEPYVSGTLLAVRAVAATVGVTRGLEPLLGLGPA